MSSSIDILEDLFTIFIMLEHLKKKTTSKRFLTYFKGCEASVLAAFDCIFEYIERNL